MFKYVYFYKSKINKCKNEKVRAYSYAENYRAVAVRKPLVVEPKDSRFVQKYVEKVVFRFVLSLCNRAGYSPCGSAYGPP
ncbi:hypothetical protein CCAND93_590037 [Capnocytophaga canis]|uniref:Uncharacterized protein n=1 Tax=Capnocytophaga canis TaxID=1848903 RepID=A0A0B7IUT0_9FLAO|nr:hypothetical protein CCAND93_590037 [Capnocytophaga canis]